MVQKVRFPYSSKPEEVMVSDPFELDENGLLPAEYEEAEEMFRDCLGEVWYEE